MRECLKNGSRLGIGGHSASEPTKIPKMKEGDYVKKDLLGLGDESEESEKRHTEIWVRGLLDCQY